jgi:large subunit ribosomal protein L3
VVTQVKTTESDGYNALQVAYGDKKEKHTLAAEKNHYAKANTPAKKFIREFRNSSMQKALGDTITTDIFTEGELVDVVGTSKGKGFQGVVKRHGFHGVGGQSHGQHDRQRAPGSLGNSSDASRVMKGMRMAGRTGGDRVKAINLRVLKIVPEQNLLVISGNIPGHKGSYVLIEK